MKRIKGLVYCGSLSLALVLSGCLSKQEKTQKETIIPVSVMTATKIVPLDEKSYVGTVEGEASSSISFQVMGNVEQVLVDEGRRVREGQLLAVLDKRTIESSYQASAASLRQAEDAYARMKVLHENNSLPDIKWVEIESKLEQARSMERISRKNLEDINLYAPYSGVIGKRMVEPGENVQPGQPVFSLLKIAVVNVKIAVPENEIAALDDQEAVVRVAALDGACFKGKITEKGVIANPVSHTYDAKIRLENPEGKLLPGMVCAVSLAGEELSSAIAVPNNAVMVSEEGDRYVWKIINGRAKAVSIRVGDLTKRGVLVLDGIQEGDIIVIGGYQKISEGMKVRAL